MPPQGRPAIRRPASDLASGLNAPALGFVSTLAPTPNNNLFQEFMWTCIEKIRDQALIAPNIETRKDALDRPLKPRNHDLYYGHLHMECYYFC